MGGALDPTVAQARLRVRRGLDDLAAGDLVLVALSGGPDSLALAAATAFVAPRAALRWGAVVVDHRLQPGSDRVAATAAECARDLGADPVRVLGVDVDPASGLGPEAAARTARHAALQQAAADASASTLLLGHTRDDQAETVLLGLARGSGARSLAGMRPRSGLLRRPFLDLTRAQTARVCAALGLHPWQDPHNTDPAHARARVRADVLAVLERELGPGIVAALARTADLLRADADLLDALAADLLAAARTDAVPGQRGGEPGPVGLDVAPLRAAPSALRGRVLRLAVLEAGSPAGDLTAGHVDAVDALVTDWHGQHGVDLPGRLRAVRRGGSLLVGAVV